MAWKDGEMTPPYAPLRLFRSRYGHFLDSILNTLNSKHSREYFKELHVQIVSSKREVSLGISICVNVKISLQNERNRGMFLSPVL